MSVGEELAEARMRAGLSVDDVDARTMIRATLIRAIESDDFAPCGGSVYARGHIRSIAHAAGIDPEPLVATFDAEHGGSPVPAAPASEVTGLAFDRTAMQRSGPRRPHWMLAAGAVLVVVCVVAAIGLVRGGSGSSGNPTPAHHPKIAAGASPSASPRPSSKSSPSPSKVSPTQRPSPITVPRGVTVSLKVTGTQSWCEFTNNEGSVLFAGLLDHGQAKKFSVSKMLKVRIGDTRQVDLVVNGHDLGQPQGKGFVANLAFGPGAPTPQEG
jgi:cytoskeletal protein RodZ